MELYRNMRGELTANTQIKLRKENYELHIITGKGDKTIVTRFVAGKVENEIFSYQLVGDYRKVIQHEAKRATEDNIEKCHSEALSQLPKIIEEFNSFYKIAAHV